MKMLCEIAILTVMSFTTITETDGQILRRQFVGDSQQMQVPVRRINIPVDLKKNLYSTDQRTDVKTTSVERNCPECIERRLIQHYMMRGCTPVIKGGCECPSRYECPTNAKLVNNTRGLFRNEKSLDSESCRLSDCLVNVDPKFEMGCTPVYSVDNCCPLRYICPKRNNLRIRGVDHGSFMCEFEGRKYPTDSSLYTDDKCVDCVCRIPPQFTCIQRKYCI